MQLFPTAASLEFVAIDIRGQLFTTKGGKQFLFAITDRFFQLIKIVPFTNISTDTVAKVFVDS